MSKDTSKKPVLELVNSAKPPPKKPSDTGGKGGGGGKGSTRPQRFGDYTVKGGAFHQVKLVKDGEGGFRETEFALCDFTCKIMEEILADDGLTDTAFLRIEGRRADGVALPLVDVPAKVIGRTSIGERCPSFIPARPKKTTYAPLSTSIRAYKAI